MARPLRIQFPGAIYHAVTRGNGRQAVFLEDRDYQRFLEGLEATVDKFSFELFGFACMPNHVHLFFRTPEPNLSRGMQYLLSGYANWFNRRHRRVGHLFQGRFKGELIEDESYFWTVSRYIHLNPVRVRRPLVERLEQWAWSSYPGYWRKTRQFSWVAHETVYRAWQGGCGGADLAAAAAAYRRFVAAGVEAPPERPWDAAIDGWLLGSSSFVERIRRLAKDPTYPDEVPQARRLGSLPLEEVLEATVRFFDVDRGVLAQPGSTTLARDIAAWLARRLTAATLRDLAPLFGLTHPDSVSNLTRRAARAMEKSSRLRKQVESLRCSLLATDKDQELQRSNSPRKIQPG